MSDIEKIEDNFSAIERYYKHGHRLTKKQQELCDRYQIAFMILKHNKNTTIAKKKYKNLMLTNGVILSDNDVYRDFKNAIDLLAPMNSMSNDFIRMTLTEGALRRIEMNQRRAAYYFNSETEKDENGKTRIINKTKDLVSYEKLMKLIQKDEEFVMKINALDSTDPEMPNFSKMEMNQININIDSNSSELLKKIMQKGSFDFNDIEDATIS
jgi:hypothetical protein